MKTYTGDLILERRCRERLRALGVGTAPISEERFIQLLERLRGKPITFHRTPLAGGRITGWVRRESKEDSITLPENISAIHETWIKLHEMSHLVVEPDDQTATSVVSVVEGEVFDGPLQLRCDRKSPLEIEVEFTASLLAALIIPVTKPRDEITAEVMNWSGGTRVAASRFAHLLAIRRRTSRR